MRMPSYEDLSKEQDAICVLAPLDGAIMVSGPPGTGKTVVAFHRAEAVAKRGQRPRVVMYNRVLHRYSGDASRNKRVREGLSTWHRWLTAWWGRVFRQQYPQVEAYVPDWDRMIPKVLGLGATPETRRQALDDWGHLIVDEGQDFAPHFYRMANVVLTHASHCAETVAITVFADENQRLSADMNSSLREIEEALGLAQDRRYHLTRNYRNTYEIARAAAHFYCGLVSGIPKLPEGRHGNPPRIIRARDLDASVDVIKRFVMSQSDLEIGVFLPTQKLQTKYFNKLSHRLFSLDGVKVQKYASGDVNHGDPEKLEFDRPGTVTVLCDQSCKGLEFDAVFIPELQARKWDPASVDHMRMQLYVLSSRARQYLTCLYSAAPEEQVPILKYFPNTESGLWEWINV